MSSSAVKVFAILRRTSGAIFGTLSQYSPISHRMLARAIGTWQVTGFRSMKVVITLFYNTSSCLNFHVGQPHIKSTEVKHTVMLSKSLAMCLMISLCCVGWVWSNFLITTTLSATTVSAKTDSHINTLTKLKTLRGSMKAFYRLCWRAAAPDRSDTCPSPQRCWWHTGRWPEWWLPQTPCPDSSHMSEERQRNNMSHNPKLNCWHQSQVIIKKHTWNSLSIVEMLASLARLVRISNYKDHRGEGG